MRYALLTLCLAMSVTSANATGKHHYTKKLVPPAFSTESVLIADFDGNIVRQRDIDLVRPIASISKLMVALLSSEQDLDELLSIPLERHVQTVIPKKVKSLTRNELLTLALVRSDNLAAQILCANIDNCVNRMNEKAIELGMFNTHYNEPTGLDRGNVSTATDLLKLVMVATINPVITSLSKLPKAEIDSGKISIKVHNTNPLTSTLNIILSKTGFTNPAGGCLVMAVNSPVGQRILILLGSKNARTRIPVMEKLYREM